MTTLSTASDAGSSAFAQADLFAEFAEQTERQIRSLLAALHDLRHHESTYRIGARGEQQAAARVERVLVDLGSTDWHLLVDRRWPGTRRANIDLLLVGPPGVLVLDVKRWRGARIEGGSLWHGQDLADDELEKVGRQSQDVADQLAEIGLAPACVLPYLVLAGQRLTGVSVHGVTVVGELSIQRELTRLGPRLTGDQVALVVAAVDEACPPVLTGPPQRCVRRTGPVPPAIDTATRMDPEQVWAGAVEAAMREPIEAWMTWLHPAQARLVTREYSGPARVRGAAGTGKTVVALHRARHLAARPDARVLVTRSSRPCRRCSGRCSSGWRPTGRTGWSSVGCTPGRWACSRPAAGSPAWTACGRRSSRRGRSSVSQGRWGRARYRAGTGRTRSAASSRGGASSSSISISRWTGSDEACRCARTCAGPCGSCWRATSSSCTPGVRAIPRTCCCWRWPASASDRSTRPTRRWSSMRCKTSPARG